MSDEALELFDPRRGCKPRTTLLSVTLALALPIGCLGLLGCSSPKTEPDYHLLTQAWNTIQRQYVDQSAVQPKELTYGAINGMVDALGDTGHSAFLTPE